MRVDVVDRGARDRPVDPLRSLAGALAGAGHGVRLFTADGPAPEPMAGVEVVRLPSRRGGAGGPPVRVLGGLLDPAAAGWIVPFELLAASGFPAGPPALGALPSVETPPDPAAASPGFFARLFGRRSARSAEARALARSGWILAPGEAERDGFLQRAAKEAYRTVVVPPVVPNPAAEPGREAARRQFHVPDDVPIAAAFAGRSAPAGTVARAAFLRARVFFPGARLLLLGPSGPTEPGVLALDDAGPGGRDAMLAAADVVLVPSGGTVLDLLGGLCRGLPVIAGPSLRLPRSLPKEALRRPESEDPGHYASDLAELFADPVLRRRIGSAGRSAADVYAPGRVADEVVRLLSGAPSPNSSRR